MTTCPGPNRTPSAIVCSCPPSSRPKEISSNARPRPRARAVNRVPRGLRQRLRQLIFTRRRALVTVRPYESLPSAESEQLARQDRKQTPGLLRPARGRPDRMRENPADRTRGGPPLHLRERSLCRWRHPVPDHALANTREAERQPPLPRPDSPPPNLLPLP